MSNQVLVSACCAVVVIVCAGLSCDAAVSLSVACVVLVFVSQNSTAGRSGGAPPRPRSSVAFGMASSVQGANGKFAEGDKVPNPRSAGVEGGSDAPSGKSVSPVDPPPGGAGDECILDFVPPPRGRGGVFVGPRTADSFRRMNQSDAAFLQLGNTFQGTPSEYSTEPMPYNAS